MNSATTASVSLTPEPAVAYSAHHAKYFAWWLTRKAPADIAVSRTLATAQVDMNPHQVEAALFALQSPLSRGMLLADEVGLGKTVEAGLVLAQYWAAAQRRILLVTPATLRKQWQQELIEKFGLPSRILDSGSCRELVKQGTTNPSRVVDEIVIAFYEFAASKAGDLSTACPARVQGRDRADQKLSRPGSADHGEREEQGAADRADERLRDVPPLRRPAQGGHLHGVGTDAAALEGLARSQWLCRPNRSAQRLEH